MDLAAQVAEIGGPAACARADDDGRAHRLASVIFPVCASARSIERIDFSALAADEYPAADYGRLCDRAGRAGKSEGPFQLEARHIFRGEPGHLGRLKPMLRGIDAPSVPMRLVQRLDEGARSCPGRRRPDRRWFLAPGPRSSPSGRARRQARESPKSSGPATSCRPAPHAASSTNLEEEARAGQSRRRSRKGKAINSRIARAGFDVRARFVQSAQNQGGAP